MPRSAWRRRSRSRICAWMVTSRAVVGSSAMRRAGPQARAMAIMARWRSPPESWWGKSRARWGAEGIWTSSSISTVRAHASWRLVPPWASTAEAIWSPMENTGLSEVIGSWNTMAMRAPRTRRMASASMARRSSPSRRTRPATTRPGGCTRRMMDSDVTLLPHPLSPTSPSTSPLSMAKLTPSTARSTPWAVAKCVSSPSTESSGGMFRVTPAHARRAGPVRRGRPPRNGLRHPTLRESQPCGLRARREGPTPPAARRPPPTTTRPVLVFRILTRQTLSLGSRVSRSQSPRRLTASTVSMMARPGKVASHHAVAT